MIRELDEIELTAFALGELPEGPARAAVEARLAGDAEAQAHVADVRAAAAMLSGELARENAMALTALQRVAIERELEAVEHPDRAVASGARRRWDGRTFRIAALSAAAAAVIVGGAGAVLLTWMHDRLEQQYRQIASSAYDGQVHVPGSLPPAPPRGNAERTPGAGGENPADSSGPSRGANGDATTAQQEPWAPSHALRERRGGRDDANAAPADVAAVGHENGNDAAPPSGSPLENPGARDAVAQSTSPADATTTNAATPPAPAAAAVAVESFGHLADRVPPGASTRIDLAGAYIPAAENPFLEVTDHPLSGFSTQTDPATYATVRRSLMARGALPPRGAVKVEALLNHFPFTVKAPAAAADKAAPAAAAVEVAGCPWNPAHRLARVVIAAAPRQPLRDVKVRIEFNPQQAAAYRLIGFDDRHLAKEDFADDARPGAPLAAGSSVTALYEIVPLAPAQVFASPARDGAALKYQSRTVTADANSSKELLTLKVRYRAGESDAPRSLELSATDAGDGHLKASDDFKFAAAVAELGLLLRDSEHKGQATYDAVIELAAEGKGKDEGAAAQRSEVVELARRAKSLAKRAPAPAARQTPQRG